MTVASSYNRNNHLPLCLVRTQLMWDNNDDHNWIWALALSNITRQNDEVSECMHLLDFERIQTTELSNGWGFGWNMSVRFNSTVIQFLLSIKYRRILFSNWEHPSL